MTRVVGVRYKYGNKVYTFDAGTHDLKVGDTVIVDSEQGIGSATVATEVREEERGADVKPLKNILRKATYDDLQRMELMKSREMEAFRVCQKNINEREMVMKLVRVEWSLDNSKATFYFTADGRVDFRDLVRDLAHRFKIRIEMRQIGVRDEAKMLGGYGPCGRALCCSSFLKDFEPVSIKMAKKQDLVLNPAKISGTCGRLMCCLGYEYSFYDEIKKSERKLKEKKLAEEKAAAAETAAPVERAQAVQPQDKTAEKPKKKRRAWRKKRGKGEGGGQQESGAKQEKPAAEQGGQKPQAGQGQPQKQPGGEQGKEQGKSGGRSRSRRRRGRRGGGGNKPEGGGGKPEGGGPKPGGAPEGGGN